MTFPASYNTSSAKDVIIAYRVKKLYGHVIIRVKTPSDNEVNANRIEHTLCDILKARYKIDVQVITDSFI